MLHEIQQGSITQLGVKSTNPDIGYKKIFGIAFPIILSNLAQNVIAIADTIFLGNLGEAELGAAALASIFYQILVMVIFGFGIGAQILMARRRGQGQNKIIGRIFQHTLWFCLFCALLCWVGFAIFGNRILGTIVNTPAVLQAVTDYMQVRIYGLVFSFAIIAFNAFYVGIAHTRTISVATLIIGVVNVALDYALVFGEWGLPRMEMRGAAMASVVAEGIGIAVYFLLTLFSPHRETYRPFAKSRFSLKLIGDLLHISYPVMIQHLLSFGSYFIFFLFLEDLGQRSLAVANITRSLYIIFLIPVWGFTATTSSLTSYLCGQKRPGEIKSMTLRCVLLALLCVSVPVGLYFPFHNTVAGIFTADPSLAAESFVPSWVVIAATYLMVFAQMVFSTIVGKGNTRAGFFIESSNIVLYFLYTWFFIHLRHCSIATAFGAEICYTLGLLLISFAYIALSRRKGPHNIKEI